ncbi:6-phosphogluconolactonase [Weissella uvarum]|uniref:lactonase family protein n=1 Tax=Weissella uvarum TaxID=1479233 RepID=UPI00195FA03F|nr:lactonase family protein [Weissella uvarum]MBM7618092.1 6-phosphogluconolactonase [Weissella uvarum]MCM0595921.1 lactonase family protein [Weissella uvarum]
MSKKVLFGSYTKRVSKGIYQADFDETTGKLSGMTAIAEIGSPTYLALSKANHLYAVDKKDQEGGIAVYDYTPGGVSLKQEVLTEGASPAYVAVDEDRQLLYTANYHKGTVEVYKIAADGQITLTDLFQGSGSGPRPEQGSSHMHFANLTPDQRLVAVDLGADKVYTFDVSYEGKLTQVAVFETTAGFGPRHIRFSPDGQTAYLLGELASELSVLHYNQADGTFVLLQTVATQPDDWDAHNGAAAIYLLADGKFIYTSNRGHNSLAVFAVNADGKIAERIQLIPTEGDFPRDFALAPDEKYVIATNQNTDNATVYRRDVQTGLLTLQEKDIAVPEPVRVMFVD